MPIHRINNDFLQRLLDNHGRIAPNLEQIPNDILAYWGEGVSEIMFVTTLYELRASMTRDTHAEHGICISNLGTPSTVTGRWGIRSDCGEHDNFFVLPNEIINLWLSRIVNVRSCVAARLAINEDRTIPNYVYFHLGEIRLNEGGGIGGEDLATGVRVPSH